MIGPNVSNHMQFGGVEIFSKKYLEKLNWFDTTQADSGLGSSHSDKRWNKHYWCDDVGVGDDGEARDDDGVCGDAGDDNLNGIELISIVETLMNVMFLAYNKKRVCGVQTPQKKLDFLQKDKLEPGTQKLFA